MRQVRLRVPGVVHGAPALHAQALDPRVRGHGEHGGRQVEGLGLAVQRVQGVPGVGEQGRRGGRPGRKEQKMTDYK